MTRPARPRYLNGYPVTDSSPHRNGYHTVLIFREEHSDPYVVATWWPALGDAWMWGHYHGNDVEAVEDFHATANRNDARSPVKG